MMRTIITADRADGVEIRAILMAAEIHTEAAAILTEAASLDGEAAHRTDTTETPAT